MKTRYITVTFLCLAYLSLLSPPVSGYSLTYNYTNLSGQIVSFSQYQGTFLLVEAFQTTCHFCINQHPILGELDNSYSSDQLNILTISIRTDDTISDIQAFVNQHPTSWDIGKDHSGTYASHEQIDSTPTMILYDENGDKIYRWVGETTLNEFTQAIDYYLTYDPGSDSTTPSFKPNDGNDGSVLGDLFGSPIFQVGFFSILVFMIYFKMAGGGKPA